MKKLYEFYCYFGRMGELSGRFVLDEEGQKELEDSYGRTVYFGEVLGKHSEIYLDLKPEHIKVITDDQVFLNRAEELKIDLDTGFNPLNYIDDSEDYDDDDDDGDDD